MQQYKAKQNKYKKQASEKLLANRLNGILLQFLHSFPALTQR
jgi:hypothetical protein